MNLLLDSHVFLRWDSQHKGLNDDTRALIFDPANQIFVSAASTCEIAIKPGLKLCRALPRLGQADALHGQRHRQSPRHSS